MSASAVQQKLDKKEQAVAFNPTHWSEENGGSGVPAGKLQVLQKFFTPVQQAKRRKERVYLPLQMEGFDDRFSTHSSSSSTSTSSAMWSLEARLEKETLPSQYRSSPSGSCREVAMEGAASHPTRENRRLGGSFTPFVRGQSAGTGNLPLGQGHPELWRQVGQAEGLEQNFYKATVLQQGPAFGEEAEIPAMWQPPKTSQHPLGRTVLRNGVVEEDGQLWKTRSSETITERPTGAKPLLAPKPRRCQQQQPQEEKPCSPKSLDLTLPKKSLILGENRRIEDKLRFSEFLNEVTQQIMSPSSLLSLGWKSQGSSPTNRAPSTKSISSESLLEKNAGKMSLPRKKGVGQFEAKGDATSIRPNQLQANAKPVRTVDEISSSSESCLFTPFLANLPELSEEPCGARRDGEGASEHVLKPKAQERSFRKAEEMVPRGAEKSGGNEWSLSVAGKSQLLYKELLVEVNPKPARSSQDLPKIPVLDSKPVFAEQDLQKKWEETLESLKENFIRIQEEYSNTRLTNQLLEEKLQRIVQTMAEERQTWNHRISELERVIRLQNIICISEKINVLDLLPKSGMQAQPEGETPLALSSEPLLDVIPPPPPFKDEASGTRSRSISALTDLSPESSKLDCSPEFDPARLLEDFEAYGPPAAKGYLRPSPPSAWKPTQFCAECANATEEYGRKERGLACPPPAPCFLYLQEASRPSPTTSPLPDPELGPFPMLHPPSLSSRSAATEHRAERSRWGRSDASLSPSTVEKTLRPSLEHQPRPKMLDSSGQTPKCLEQEGIQEKGADLARPHCIAVHGEEPPSPGETGSEGKLRPGLQQLGDMLRQVSKGGGRGRQNFAAIQDSTFL